MSTFDTPMNLFTRVVFAFVAVNALAGAVILIGFPDRTAEWFFWTITPPINAALLGALYLSGAIVVGLLTWRGVWEPARVLVPVLVPAGVVIAIITLVHVDKFTAGIKLVYWLVVYIGAPLLALAVYWLQERRGANWRVNTAVTNATRRTAIVVGALIFAVCTVFLFYPRAIVEHWPWPTGVLMVRVFTIWFGVFGAGLLWFAVDREWSRLRHIATLMIAAAVLDLIVVALHRDAITGDALTVGLYLSHLVAFALVGALMHFWQRSAAVRTR